jgi:hypothetical protein
MIEFPIAFAVGLALDAYVKRAAIRRWFKPTAFLRPDIPWLLDLYSDEEPLADSLPYQELARWIPEGACTVMCWS